jgi:hypothetical protein
MSDYPSDEMLTHWREVTGWITYMRVTEVYAEEPAAKEEEDPEGPHIPCDCWACDIFQAFLQQDGKLPDFVPPPCKRCGHRGYELIDFDCEENGVDYYQYKCENCGEKRDFPEERFGAAEEVKKRLEGN